jgi:periplasmic mercuric ion binding protein
MKFVQLFLMAILFIASSAIAQQKVAGKAIIKTLGITCEICKDRVERSLFKMYGVTSVKADFKKHTTTVTWLTDRTNIEEIKTAIANAGYDADDVTAEDDAYKRLPAGCKKTAEVIAPTMPTPAVPVVDTAKVPSTQATNTKPTLVQPTKKVFVDKKKLLINVKNKTTK